MKKKFPKIILLLLAVLIPAGLVLYIFFAPDTWWKPVSIRFDAQEVSAASDPATAATATTTAGPVTPPAVDPVQPASSQTMLPGSAVQAGQGVMYELGSKVVNLAEPGGLRYLQVSLVLEFHPSVQAYYEAQASTENTGAAEGESKTATTTDPFKAALDAQRPLIDDTIMTLLSSKTYKDIATIDGKQQLKQELMTKINQALGYQGVINVYFTDFVIQ